MLLRSVDSYDLADTLPAQQFYPEWCQERRYDKRKYGGHKYLIGRVLQKRYHIFTSASTIASNPIPRDALTKTTSPGAISCLTISAPAFESAQVMTDLGLMPDLTALSAIMRLSFPMATRTFTPSDAAISPICLCASADTGPSSNISPKTAICL